MRNRLRGFLIASSRQGAQKWGLVYDSSGQYTYTYYFNYGVYIGKIQAAD